MPIKDPFSYSGRFSDVDIDCAGCSNYRSKNKLGEVEKEPFCKKHQLPLTIRLTTEGYTRGAWFCKNLK